MSSKKVRRLNAVRQDLESEGLEPTPEAMKGRLRRKKAHKREARRDHSVRRR